MHEATLKKVEFTWCDRNARIVPAVAIVVFSSLFSASSKAACVVSPGAAQSTLALPPELRADAPPLHPLESPSDSPVHNSHADITGLWFVTFYTGGVAFDQGFDVWHSDGTEILNDNGPPEQAWSTGSFCMGVWKLIGDDTYKLKHVGWNFDGNGNLSAIVVIKQTVTLDADTDRYRGSLEIDTYDPVSGNLTSRIIDEVKAHRIRVD